MDLHRSYRLELDPNRYIRSMLVQHAGAARWAYNWSLARRIERFENATGEDKFTSHIDESRELNALKSSDYPWLRDLSKCAPQYALENVEKAFKNFWANRSKGVGFPKFKKKNASRDSFKLTGVIKYKGRHVQLPRLGKIRIKNDPEKVNLRGRILSATVSRTADRWFVSLNVVIEDLPEPVPVEGPAVGIDVGITSFITTSEGVKASPPNPLRKALRKLKKANQNLSRKQKGSKNRAKARMKVAKIHAHVANVRKDFLHKLTSELAKTKSVIVVENLNVKGMVRNKYLARSLNDVSFGEFKRQLEYKTKWYGSKLIKVSTWYPSTKMCSCCGFKLRKIGIGVRSWKCPECHTQHDRDLNAARNILEEGLRGLHGAESSGTQMPVETPLPAERVKTRSTRHGSKKQEVGLGITS